MQDRLYKSIKSIASIALWASVLHALFALLGGSIDNIINAVTTKSLLELVIFNKAIWGFHLWYLFAYLYVLIAVHIFIEYRVIQKLYYAIPILLFASVLFGNYNYLIFDSSTSIPYYYTTNFLFAGIPYFLIGVLIKRHEIKLVSKAVYAAILCALIFSLSTYEVIFINPKAVAPYIDGCFYWMTAPFAISILLLALSIKQKRDTIFSRIGRKYSLDIYVFHFLVIRVLLLFNEPIKAIIGDRAYGVYQNISPILIFIFALLIGVVLRKYMIPTLKEGVERAHCFGKKIVTLALR